MRWTRPRRNRWLLACLLALLVSVWAGGLSFSVLLVFLIIFAAGSALIGHEFPAPVAEQPWVGEDGAGDDLRPSDDPSRA